jgi:hypothetical protein
MCHDRAIPFQEPVEAHLGHDVGGSVHVVSGEPAGQPVFLLKPIKSLVPGGALIMPTIAVTIPLF